MALKLLTDEILLITGEVLEYLNVTLRTVYRLIKAGSIPGMRVGRQWRFRKRDIDAWLEKQRPRAATANTAYSTESNAIEALNLGVSGYLTKPFGVAQVLAAAAKALGVPDA